MIIMNQLNEEIERILDVENILPLIDNTNELRDVILHEGYNLGTKKELTDSLKKIEKELPRAAEKIVNDIILSRYM